MCLELIKKLLNPQPDTCQADLAKCNQDKVELNGKLADFGVKLATSENNLRTCGEQLLAAQKALDPIKKERDDLLALSDLLVKGPPTPDPASLRWLPHNFIDETMTRQLGVKYSACTARHFSEADWVVTTVAEMKRFIDYYAMFWMKNIHYVTQEFTKLNGEKVTIWMNDCDNYSDFFKGLPAINPNWACFPWAQIWAEVQGILLAGGHAFNCFIAHDGTYNEASSNGLKAYLLEPQMAGGGPWPARRPEITGYEIKELREVAGLFEIKGTIWMFKI